MTVGLSVTNMKARLTVSEQVVLLAAQRVFVRLATAEPQPLQPELGVKLHQNSRVVLDLWTNGTEQKEGGQHRDTHMQLPLDPFL